MCLCSGQLVEPAARALISHVCGAGGNPWLGASDGSAAPAFSSSVDAFEDSMARHVCVKFSVEADTNPQTFSVGYQTVGVVLLCEENPSDFII